MTNILQENTEARLEGSGYTPTASDYALLDRAVENLQNTLTSDHLSADYESLILAKMQNILENSEDYVEGGKIDERLSVIVSVLS